jgi:hypothetical protein
VSRRGIDTDNWDGPVSTGRFQTLHDLWEVRFNIVGCQVGDDQRNYTPQQIVSSEQAGLEVPFVYDFMHYAGKTDAEDLERMKHAAGFGRPVAPDVEGDAHAGGHLGMIQLLAEAKHQLEREGLFWGWYSSPPEWARLTGGTLAFAGDRGWTAAYPFSSATQAVLPPADYMPDFAHAPAFGQTLPIVWQYANICYGEPNFDMNAWNPAYLAGDDVMIRHNATSSWYENPAHQAFTGTAGINGTIDFALPPDAVAVHLCIETFADSSWVQARDGNEALAAPPAFDVTPPALYFAGRVELERIDGDAWCHLAASDVGHLRHVSCVGFYRA